MATSTEADIDLPVGYDEDQIDRLVRALFEARAQSPLPMDDEAWARRKASPVSAGTLRILRADIIDQINSGDFTLDD